ncbi:hypothetical protein HanXRQr2_Chr10g0420911 [Helianthus annuus]|uniref:Uncharacterized protein n=1 Tax=Helianthus annuus TaxID=4232 RepID=A0A9K3HUM6_HELAN|nr:hypothetical protein HanXRQr2_Chr10g0420911 [Helianthus annuus]
MMVVLVVEFLTSCGWRSWISDRKNLIGSTPLSFYTSCLRHDCPSWELSGQVLAHADWAQPLPSILLYLS